MSHSSKPTTTTTVLDLNDHVLRETFQNLNASELCAIADVCSAFKRNAQAEFALRFNVLNFENNARYDEERIEFHIRQLAPVLRNFGASTVSIRIYLPHSLREQSPQVGKLLGRYCGKSLKELISYHINFTADMIQQLRPLLPRLEVLRLLLCFDTSESVASEMFSLCTQLHTLSFIEMRPVTLGAPVALHKLKSLQIQYLEDYSVRAVEPFLELNPQLKEISLNCYDSSITSEIIQSIARCTPVENLKSSDTLMIIGSLGEITELNLLFYNSLSINDLVDIVRCAPKLRTLRHNAVKPFDADVFMKIRNIVAERKENVPLILLSQNVKPIVPKKMLDANKDILTIGNYYFDEHGTIKIRNWNAA